jgi:putative endonuclease
MFYVYLLHSIADSGFYIGYTTDLRRRLSEHKQGAVATRHRGPWKLIYYEAYTERLDAEGRERYLKSGGGRHFLRRQLRHYLIISRNFQIAAQLSEANRDPA